MADISVTENQIELLRNFVTGRMDVARFEARFQEADTADIVELIGAGLMRFDGSYYYLTLQGRECVKSQNYTAEKVETISTKSPIEVPGDLSMGVVDQPIVKGDEKSLTLKILEYIEAHPLCTTGDLAKIGAKQITNILRGHIKSGFVLVVGKRGRGNRLKFRIADGLKVSDFYGKNKTCKKALSRDLNGENSVAVAPEPTVNIKEVERPSLVVSDEDAVIASYDSNGCLSIDSLTLTPCQTKTLLAFIHDLGLVN